MENERFEWWPEDQKECSRPFRLQLALVPPIALLRMELSAPNDRSDTEPRELKQVFLTARQCRGLAQQLTETADALDAAS